ncbi:EAL domain-containing protein [Aestuariibacter halophilus]|uniref:EAL domain-containing protein n=1 Tax=Fluctibacter halophilus TaxID=226011 RepID=A0ABS8G952_9ALTE|nr:EAL domain-containing protein [Aestuariibacter halophilus]MCC2617099.1 EAL domain-containing protein [Aestuariibacter halophilus]
MITAVQQCIPRNKPLLLVCVWLCLVQSALALPLLKEPKFTQVSTEQGLSQDSVHDMLVDHEGFLWLGTGAGLNRYDGYSIKKVSGLNDILADQTVYSLFQDSRKNLWVATESNGNYLLELSTQRVFHIGNWAYNMQPDWLQYASMFTEDEHGNVWIVISEQVIKVSREAIEGILSSPATASTEIGSDIGEVMFELPMSLVENQQSIRNVLLHGSYLVVATTQGLYLKNLQSGEQQLIDYLGDIEANINNLNTKRLFLDRENTLWVGTVEGLYSAPIDQIISMFEGEATMVAFNAHAEERNIWQILPRAGMPHYLVTDLGLYIYQVEGDQLQHLFRPTDSRLYLTSDELVGAIYDRHNNLWLSTRYDGALYWSPKSTRFTNIVNTRGENASLSTNDVWSVAQSTDNELWIGTNNGLNRYDLDSGDIDSFLVNDDKKAVYSDSSIEQIMPASDGTLWLVSAAGLQRFDPTNSEFRPLNVDGEETQKTLSGILWGATLDSQGRVVFATEQGIKRYDPRHGSITDLESLNTQIPAVEVYHIRYVPSVFEDSLLISSLGKLWRYDENTGQLTLIHQLPRTGQQHMIGWDSVVTDRNGTLWVTYPGWGLYGIDAETYEQRAHYDQDNLLPDTNIYGLQLDGDGNIWMSSHQGLFKFYPYTQHIQRFGYSEGLSTLEFNQGAATRLRDGRMVYGSQKGVTLFHPQDMQYKVRQSFGVSITDIGLSSQRLNLPVADLNGQQLTLEHDDVGLRIAFSTLTYEHQSSTRYAYKLSGSSSLVYPVTRDPELIIPTLKPGQYTFTVSAFDPISGKESLPAEVSITVRYAWWASPLAYSLYGFCILMLLFLYWYRSRLQNAKIMAAHQEALTSRNRMTLALTASNSNVWEWRSDTNTVSAPRIVDELGYPDMGQDVSFEQQLSLMHPQDKLLYEARWQSFMDNPKPGFDVTFRMRAEDGSWNWYRDVGSLVSDTSAGMRVVTGTYSNVTESLANIEKVRLFGEAFKHTRDWVVIFNGQHKPIAANQAFCEAFSINENGDLDKQVRREFGLDSAEVPRFWSKLLELSATQHWKGEEELVLRDGRTSNVLINMTSIASMRDLGVVDYYLMIMSDISEQKEAEQELRRLANYDSLTNLPNRTLLLDRIKHGIDHARRYKSQIALFFIDLDRFKQVNDSLGHKAGDELLRVVAQRLTNLLRQDDTVARLGGDEFVVMVEEIVHADKLSTLAQEIIAVVEEPVQLGNQTVSVSSSVGIAMFPGDANSSEELLKNADVAMYHAKELGRSNFQYFTEQMNEKAQARLTLENQLKKAHQSKQFENFYQPIVGMDSGRVEGFELLMRWPNEDGMIPPDIFIPVAEELGLIENMTWDAIERALPVLSQWQQPDRQVYLSVNLSARHFERQISIENILTLLRRHKLPVSVLRFEITESALMHDYERALEYMHAMCDAGFNIALDDFGTGYSSLKYLKEFPIQILKVDKSFVDDIGKNSSNEALVLTTLRMAESLDMVCVAEGIEDARQVAFFRQHGCEYLQGYFFSKPVPSDETLALIDKSWVL